MKAPRPRLQRDGQSASPLEAVRWVAGNIGSAQARAASGKRLPARSAPSAEAAALLVWVLKDPENEKFFWGMWSKLLPSRSQVEEDCRPRYTGSDNVQRLLDKHRAFFEGKAETS